MSTWYDRCVSEFQVNHLTVQTIGKTWMDVIAPIMQIFSTLSTPRDSICDKLLVNVLIVGLY